MKREKKTRASTDAIRTFLSPTNNHQVDNSEEKTAERGCKKSMKVPKKLILISGCYKHSTEFKPGSQRAFWAIICQFVKELTSYNLKKLRNTVFCLKAICVNKLVEEEMESAT